MRRRLIFILPVLVLVALMGFFWRGLYLNPTIVSSPLIGKPVPDFILSRLHKPNETFDQNQLKGQVSLVNVWATWCVACRDEQQTLLAFSRQHVVPIYGLDYKDDRQSAIQWLATRGDPYSEVAFDPTGNVAINWGVYGAPETFLIDAHGIIRYKYIGAITTEVIRKELMPRIQALHRERT
jgi:cytochrome c biogenesis protein CcmG, thiol:disulfide interchange protein DsbE